MPAPPFLVGVGVGFSAAALARVAAESEPDAKGDKKAKGSKGGDAMQGGNGARKGPLMVTPKGPAV